MGKCNSEAKLLLSEILSSRQSSCAKRIKVSIKIPKESRRRIKPGFRSPTASLTLHIRIVESCGITCCDRGHLMPHPDRCPSRTEEILKTFAVEPLKKLRENAAGN